MKPAISPKELATAIGVSESSVKRWVDDGTIDASRTAGGHRRISIAEAIRFIRETRSPIVRPDILGLSDLAALSGEEPSTRSPAERFHSYLREGRAQEARGLILSLYVAGESVASICDGPAREAMARLGELWRRQPDGVFLEHRATEICIQSIMQLRLTFSSSDEGPVATGCGIARDPYLLPTLMAAVVLESLGFRAVNLGPDTPTRTLRDAIDQHRPVLVWLSASSVADVDAASKEIGKLVLDLGKIDTPVILGGREREVLKLPPAKNLYVASGLSELTAFASGLSTRP